jgi:hypothetical protein
MEAGEAKWEVERVKPFHGAFCRQRLLNRYSDITYVVVVSNCTTSISVCSFGLLHSYPSDLLNQYGFHYYFWPRCRSWPGMFDSFALLKLLLMLICMFCGSWCRVDDAIHVFVMLSG